jgi:hypothetical protein
MREVSRPGVLVLGLLALVAAPAQAVDEEAIERSIARGVAALKTMQRADGTWHYHEMGATALAGLTLLECGVASDDSAVVKAARVVRQQGILCMHTYSLALGILFLDRLGDPEDIPLIESMGVRLLGGQEPQGGWSYRCPGVNTEEMERLRGLLRTRKAPASRAAPKEEGKRTVRDLAPEIQEQLARLARQGLQPSANPADNSNTQFAILGLWVARRHGIPIANALSLVEARFRAGQNPDGGWGYLLRRRVTDDDQNFSSSATMTCAGILALAIVHGAVADAVRDGDPKVKPRDVSKDKSLLGGLAALSTTVGEPGTIKGRSPLPAGKNYYFLWSLERICMALDLEALHTKDWYGWGAEFVLANQEDDGSWRGLYAESGADTCFALLFLKRANLVRDLTASMKGKLKGPTDRALRTGDLRGPGKLRPPTDPPKDK